MYRFTESITLHLPKIAEQLHSIQEADQTNRFKVVTEIAAIHTGITANFNMYTESALSASVGTWIEPYPKPIIVNHDELSKPLGRVMSARIDRESDGTAFIALQAAILDREAAEMVIDEQYVTGSVGGSARQSLCSICGVDWAAPQESSKELPCRHQRGKVYDGKLAYRELHGITWMEYSLVNIPSDRHSRILSARTSESQIENIDIQEGIKFYSLDMDEPSIVKITESASTNILDDMQKREATYTYKNLKDTFLNVSVFDDIKAYTDRELFKLSNNNNTIESETVVSDDVFAVQEKETMTKVDTELQDDDKDILTVAEELRTSTVEAEEIVDADSNDSEVVETEEMVEGSTEESDSAEITEEVAEENSEEETTQEAETESEEEPLVESETDVVSDTEVTEESEEAPVTEDLDKEVQTEVEVINPELDELRSQVETLQTENQKLRQHLHFLLAERVVDAKISLGMLKESERVEDIKEHETRTPSSLADALKDLQRMTVPVKAVNRETVQMDMKLAAVEDGNTEFIDEKVEEAPKVSESDRFVETFTQTLMGRKSL